MKALIALAIPLLVSGVALAQESFAPPSGSKCWLWGKAYRHGAQVTVTYYNDQGGSWDITWTCNNGTWR